MPAGLDDPARQRRKQKRIERKIALGTDTETPGRHDRAFSFRGVVADAAAWPITYSAVPSVHFLTTSGCSLTHFLAFSYGSLPGFWFISITSPICSGVQ